MSRLKWIEPLDITFTDQGIWTPDGRTQRIEQISWPAEVIERIRAGYQCAKCLEPLEESWPERCPRCGAPIRSEQASYFAREFGGEVRLGSSTTISDERERLKEGRNGS